MSILLIAGSPSERSRSSALLSMTGQRLSAKGLHAETLRLRDLPPQALLLAEFNNPALVRVASQVAAAKVVVIATPVYKAAYSGILKVFLDFLSQTALKGKTVLPLATGGSPHHMLALDYALHPVLHSLGAKNILPGIYANDSEMMITSDGAYSASGEIGRRLDDAVDTLVIEHLKVNPLHANQFSNVHFSQVRCSV
jgi:FMN reductase